MPNDVLRTLLEGVASGVLASVAYAIYSKITDRVGQESVPTRQYSERLAELTSSLKEASSEVDTILRELSEVAQKREAAVRQLESDLSVMESKERELKDRIETLARTPIPVADHFAKLLELGEKRSARRDYLLFGAGVVITTAIAIIMELIKHNA